MMNNPLINTRVKEETWFTLKELSDLTYTNQYGLHFTPYLDNIKLEWIFLTWEDSFAIDDNERFVITSGDNISFRSTNLAMVLNLVWSRYWKHYCIQNLAPKNNYGEYPEETKEAIFEFYLKIHNIVKMTENKYSTLLDLYDTLGGAELLNKVTTSANGTSRFNDTPQESGEFDDDEHTSHITQTTGESATDMNTPIERLKEIHDKFNNILLEWCNEFDKLFIEGDNV